MAEASWFEVGRVDELERCELTAVVARRTPLVVVRREGRFAVLNGRCNHVGGPLGEGHLDGDYLVCPWHYWKFHWETGEGEPGYEEDRIPSYPVKIEDGRLWVDLDNGTKRSRKPHSPHRLARKVEREPGPVRLVGISTTAMTKGHPRYSTSDHLLESAVNHSRELGCEAQLIRLGELSFRACEGFYSKSAHACTWPCSITQMDPHDQLDAVYEAFVHWADAILVATPIRWGAPSSLYQKMVERMNCIQNQETIANRHLMRNKAAGFVITGGQDNVQAVAGMMLGFFAELGCQFPQFPYIAHSRGWSAEDMENNVRAVQHSERLHQGARSLAERTIAMAQLLVAGQIPEGALVRGGRKAHRLDD